MKKSILATLILSGILSAACVSNGDKTVTCSDTGLTWQDDSEVGSVSKTWEEALIYCNTLPLAGGNWRLPNIKELKSITDRINKYNPSLKDGFTNKSTNWFWSSTTTKSYTSTAWGVGFDYGDDRWGNKTSTYSVRCVR